MDTVNITVEAIRELAQKHPEVAEDLKVLCPDAFTEPGPFEFSPKHTLSSGSTSHPLFIGSAYAPSGLALKCLVVHRDWRMETQEHDGRTILTFYRK